MEWTNEGKYLDTYGEGNNGKRGGELDDFWGLDTKEKWGYPQLGHEIHQSMILIF